MTFTNSAAAREAETAATPSRRDRSAVCRDRRAAARTGLTIVELLVVLAVILTLVAVLLPIAQGVRERAAEASESSAARSLLTAWNLYAFEQRGRILPGYRSGLPAFDQSGNAIASQTIGVAAARYPWRIAPYLGNAIDELFTPAVRSSLRAIEPTARSEYLYRSSLHPRFGLNSTFIGGDEGYGGFSEAFRTVFGEFYRESLSTVIRPQEVLAFASAAATDAESPSGGVVEGWFRLRAPQFTGAVWSDPIDPRDPASSGHLAPRRGDRCIAGFTDGHVEIRPIETLRDMRLWADQADRPDWRLEPR